MSRAKMSGPVPAEETRVLQEPAVPWQPGLPAYDVLRCPNCGQSDQQPVQQAQPDVFQCPVCQHVFPRLALSAPFYTQQP